MGWGRELVAYDVGPNICALTLLHTALKDQGQLRRIKVSALFTHPPTLKVSSWGFPRGPRPFDDLKAGTGGNSPLDSPTDRDGLRTRGDGPGLRHSALPIIH